MDSHLGHCLSAHVEWYKILLEHEESWTCVPTSHPHTQHLGCSGHASWQTQDASVTMLPSSAGGTPWTP